MKDAADYARHVANHRDYLHKLAERIESGENVAADPLARVSVAGALREKAARLSDKPKRPRGRPQRIDHFGVVFDYVVARSEGMNHTHAEAFVVEKHGEHAAKIVREGKSFIAFLLRGVGAA